MCVGTFYYMHTIKKADLGTVRAYTFSLLCGLQLFQALAVKSERDFAIGNLLRSPYMIAAVLICGFMQLAVVTIPPVAKFFHVTPLGLKDILIITLMSSSIFWLVEIEKYFNRPKYEEKK